MKKLAIMFVCDSYVFGSRTILVVTSRTRTQHGLLDVCVCVYFAHLNNLADYIHDVSVVLCMSL